MNKAVLSLLAVTVAASGTAFATGNAAAGRSKAGECAACHGFSGASANEESPNLAGQKYAYLVEQLQAFRDGSRRNPVMAPIARQLSDQDVGDLAAYFSAQKGAPPVFSTQINKGGVDKGSRISSQCTACHGLTGMSPTSTRAAAWPEPGRPETCVHRRAAAGVSTGCDARIR